MGAPLGRKGHAGVVWTHANFPTFTFLHLVKAVISMIALYDRLSYLKEVFIWIFINCKFGLITHANFPTFTFVASYMWCTRLLYIYYCFLTVNLNLFNCNFGSLLKFAVFFMITLCDVSFHMIFLVNQLYIWSKRKKKWDSMCYNDG